MGDLFGHLPPGRFPLAPGQQGSAPFQFLHHEIILLYQSPDLIVPLIMEGLVLLTQAHMGNAALQYTQGLGDPVRQDHTQAQQDQQEYQVKVHQGHHHIGHVPCEHLRLGEVGQVQVGQQVVLTVQQGDICRGVDQRADSFPVNILRGRTAGQFFIDQPVHPPAQQVPLEDFRAGSGQEHALRIIEINV